MEGFLFYFFFVQHPIHRQDDVLSVVAASEVNRHGSLAAAVTGLLRGIPDVEPLDWSFHFDPDEMSPFCGKGTRCTFHDDDLQSRKE